VDRRHGGVEGWIRGWRGRGVDEEDWDRLGED
jgi:hypothetical protein